MGRGQVVLKDHLTEVIFTLMTVRAIKGFKQRSDRIGTKQFVRTAINLDCLGWFKALQ